MPRLAAHPRALLLVVARLSKKGNQTDDLAPSQGLTLSNQPRRYPIIPLLSLTPGRKFPIFLIVIPYPLVPRRPRLKSSFKMAVVYRFQAPENLAKTSASKSRRSRKVYLALLRFGITWSRYSTIPFLFFGRQLRSPNRLNAFLCQQSLMP